MTSDSGTGIVHQAPAFGEDDHRIAIREKIVRKDEMPPCPIDERGMYTDEVGEFIRGMYVKVRFGHGYCERERELTRVWCKGRRQGHHQALEGERSLDRLDDPLAFVPFLLAVRVARSPACDA